MIFRQGFLEEKWFDFTIYLRLNRMYVIKKQLNK